MKKIIVIFMLPVFLLSTTIGVTMTSLYCNGKLSKTGIVVKACCKKVNKGGCCKTEVKLLKVNDDFLKTTESFNLNKILNLFYSIIPSFSETGVKTVFKFKYYSDKAPPLKNNSLYILFNTFLI